MRLCGWVTAGREQSWFGVEGFSYFRGMTAVTSPHAALGWDVGRSSSWAGRHSEHSKDGVGGGCNWKDCKLLPKEVMSSGQRNHQLLAGQEPRLMVLRAHCCLQQDSRL